MKFQQSRKVAEEFNSGEAVRDAQTLYMTAECEKS
jgi:hypothetical protein